MIVHIVTRHSADCPHLGDEPHKKCNWWKHLRYRENGKLKWKTTEQQTWAGAERFKTNFLLQRDPAHAHLAAQLPKTVTVRDAVNAFLDDKRGQNLQDSSVGKYTLQLAERLATIHNGHADYFFWNGTATHTSIAAGRVHTLGKLFDKAKMPYAHSHMFRRTFAIEWLKAGLTWFGVSTLLGHASVKTTEKYYAAWVQGLQVKMENSMRAHWRQTGSGMKKKKKRT
jgi:hypothetical protein